MSEPATSPDVDALDPNSAADIDPDSGGGRRSRRVAPYLALVVAIVVGALILMLATSTERGDSAATHLLDRPAPAAVGEFADGTSFDLSRRKGGWVVLNFFTDNCVPCIREHPELIRFVEQQRSLGTDGAEFYTIVQHSSRDDVEAFFAERGGDWPIVYDIEFEFQTQFGVAQVPETWIIDPSGYVRGRIISEVDADTLSGAIQKMREAGL